MNELLEVYENLLDNADLDISLSEPSYSSSSVLLDFVVGGSLENIIISCGEYSFLKIIKDWEEGQCFFVGKTTIKTISSRSEIQELERIYDLPARLETSIFHVQCLGGYIDVEILCNSLAWKRNDGEFKSILLPSLTE